jgi:hypothetical protein
MPACSQRIVVFVGRDAPVSFRGYRAVRFAFPNNAARYLNDAPYKHWNGAGHERESHLSATAA